MLYSHLKSRMEQFPSATLRDNAQEVSYAQLLAEAEDLGRQLCQAPKYGILCHSQLNSLRGLLACFFAHKTAVPLSHLYGEAHTTKNIQAANISHLITDEGIRAIGKGSAESHDLTDVALIMCTSGTTGSPKAAMISPANLLCNLQDIAAYFGVTARDRMLVGRPLYHCAVLTGEVLLGLHNGACIDFLSGALTPHSLLRAIREHNATVCCGTPTLFHYLCRMDHTNTLHLLERIAVSGERLTEHVAASLQKSCPNADIHHVYGLTEASPRVSHLPPSRFADKSTSIGIPLDHVQTRLMPCDNGELELLVRGGNVMKGYYNDDDATRRVLCDGWLRTGDLATHDDEGYLYIKGRADDLMIRAGMNIYPQEIEDVLRQHPDITDSLCSGTQAPDGQMQLHLDVITAALSPQDIYQFCLQQLPSYQLPDNIMVVSELPRNASGKLIRKRS